MDETGSGINPEDLVKIIANLQKEVENLKQKNNQSETIIQGTYDNVDDDLANIDIHPDKYIKIINLDCYPLNISTEGMGRGRLYRFDEFGDVKRIPYKYLVDIIEHHRNFVKAGKFYILDKNVIRQQGLEDDYSKILTREKIEAILNGNDRDITISLFQSANKAQQEVICQMLIDRRIAGENIDLNIWDKIDRLADMDLEAKYKTTKEYLDSLNSSKESKQD
ncbi:MAG: hypothetical protein EHM34_07200 [Nitrosopumilales archaeon]|nr:MAG: hypothetical protein EHM34_07200 [Nitrosopumilales archaeon]